jgi:transposase
MLNFSHQTRVFLFLEPVDMRKSFRGLCQLAESVLKQDPASGHWFAFINRRGDRLKLLGWDGQGFWIWYKRLESGVFQKPDAGADAAQLEIDVTQLALIIHGIDLRSAKRRRRYQANAQVA